MYTLSLVVWAVLGSAPVVDTTKNYTTFEQCEADRIKYNKIYESDLALHEIVGYETTCKGTSRK